MDKPADYPERLMIEPMGEEDIEPVAAIEEDSFSDPWPLEAFRTELENNRLSSYFVARLDGEVIAYIGAWLVHDEVHITTLAVAKHHRRQGIASRLLEALIEAACPQGARYFTLEVRPSNKAALNFYEKCGFTVLGRRHRYYNDEDALIMTRENLQPPGD